ncbi:hypothetical protein [Mucilaginibacter phyllosphaerae]
MILKQAAETNAASTLLSAGIPINELSKSQAYRRFGRTNVDRWLREGLINIIDKKINRQALDAVAAESNTITYLRVAER